MIYKKFKKMFCFVFLSQTETIHEDKTIGQGLLFAVEGIFY